MLKKSRATMDFTFVKVHGHHVTYKGTHVNMPADPGFMGVCLKQCVDLDLGGIEQLCVALCSFV